MAVSWRDFFTQETEIRGTSEIQIKEFFHELTVKEQVIEALRAKLASSETQETQVLDRLQVNEDIELIVRKRI